jgi:uncharacterized protein
MSLETAFAAVDMAMKSNDSTGLVFFGGEPLLEKELIYKTVEYSKKRAVEVNYQHKFYYKITTTDCCLTRSFCSSQKTAAWLSASPTTD